MEGVGRKVAAVAGSEFTRLPADFGAGPPRKHVADLLDARMHVRQRAATLAAHHAEHHLNAFGTHGFRADQTAIDGLFMVGRTVRGCVSFADEVAWI